MLRTPVAPVLLSLVAAAALSGCAKRNATDSSIGVPEPMSGGTVAGPGGGSYGAASPAQTRPTTWTRSPRARRPATTATRP